MHGLKIFVFVTIGNGGIQSANLGSESIHAGSAANNSRPQLLAILHHEYAVIRQATDDAVGTVDNQLPAGLL
jgi:hypothetical protein